MVLDLRRGGESFPAARQDSPNLRYGIEDIALSAFSVFYLQSPSFLSYQNQLERRHGSSNLSSLFGIEKVPTDNQIRKVLDNAPPDLLFPMFRKGFERLKNHKTFNKFKVLCDKILIALDGCQHFSSSKISCPSCRTKTHKTGKTTYQHSFIGASLCAPGNSHVLSLEPEFMTPQDGHDKQDSEQAATKRWLEKYGAFYASQGAIFLGDDLYSRQPTCAAFLEKGADFILVCKPDSHKFLYDFIDGADLGKVTVKGKRGKYSQYSFITNVPLNGRKDSLTVNWCMMEEFDKNGKRLYKNAFVTSLTITKKTVADIADCGRARWKIENETFNTLKTKGYNLEHNYGHGKKNLCNLLATMNLLAFTFHTLADLMDEKYQTINGLIKCRREFFEEIRTITKYMLFTSWDHLYNTILNSFKPRDGTAKK
jgi:hypothetical protein